MIDAQLFCSTLKFAAHAAAQKDVRHYLLGVHIKAYSEALTLCGTDGKRVALCSLTLEQPLPFDGDIIVANADVKRLLSTFGKLKGSIALTITYAPTPDLPTELKVVGGGFALTLSGIQGTHPDVRRVIPSAGRKRGAMPVIDAPLIAAACVALQPLAAKFGTKGSTAPLTFEASGEEMDPIVVRPLGIADPRISELLVVVSPLRV